MYPRPHLRYLPTVSHTEEKVRSLYVHVPFCAHKCEYCAFFSETAKGELVNKYVDALVAEIGLVAHDLEPETIFFGGGTPSLLNLEQWSKILEAIHRLNLSRLSEWTVECNPATVSLDKGRLLRGAGVNRISMGVQSLDATLLDRLGRVHSREMVFKSFDTLRQAGFENINVDLMFAIPGQSMDIWRATLREALALGSEHLSSYEVIYEEDTPLFEQLKAGQFDVNEDLACDMYEKLLSISAAHGFRQYEIANFARSQSSDAEVPDYACRHNINYWRAGSYYGLGPSATGYVRGVREKNWSNTALYCEKLIRGSRAIESREELPPLSRAGEMAAFGLRMNAGWPLQQFQNKTGYALPVEWKSEIDQLVSGGFAALNPERFFLTPQGLRHADWVAEQFLRLSS